MRKVNPLILVLTCVGLVSCSWGVALPSPAIASLTPSLPATVQRSPTQTTPPTPSVTPTTESSSTPLPDTPTSTALPEKILRNEFVELLPSIPPGSKPPGTLILQGYGETLSISIDFGQNRINEFPENSFSFSSSPNGKWLAYCQRLEQGDSLLHIQSADGKEKKQLHKDKSWRCPEWLDNQTLIDTLSPRDTGEPPSILPEVIIDPFTGESTVLESDYPDLIPSDMGLGGIRFDFVNSTVVYHPSLDFVIYPKRNREGMWVVLWDRRSQTALASVEDLYQFGHAPIWSSDEGQFAVAVTPPGGLRSADYSEFINEWFIVGLDGKVEQATHFADLFSHAEIGYASWSPDGQRLAFFLTTTPAECGGETHTAVLELKTRQVTRYCIQEFASLGYPIPVWSPDSQYIALFDEGAERVIVLAVDESWAAQVAGDVLPSAWLATP